MAEVIVAGSVNMDIVARVARHPRPSETVGGRDLRFSPGGKGANQAVAAARGGARVRLLGAVGDDAFADQLLAFLDGVGIDTGGVHRRADLGTGVALNVVAEDGENTVVSVPGANGSLTERVVSEVGARSGDVLVAQYEVPLAFDIAFFRHGRQVGATTILNPAPAGPVPNELLELTDVLVVNQTELATVSGIAVGTDPSFDDVAGALERLRSRGFSGVAVATLGQAGALAMVGSGVIHLDAHAVTAVDTTGAGDCFVGYLAAELVGGSTVAAALAWANAAAAVSVTRHGAGPSVPERAEVGHVMVQASRPSSGLRSKLEQRSAQTRFEACRGRGPCQPDSGG